MLKLKVSDIMTKKPVVVKPSLSVEDGAKLMLKNNIGNLIIEENGILKGIITEKDFVERVVAKSLDPKKTKISDVMTKKINVTLTPDKAVLEAMKLMDEHDIRRIPVLDNQGKLIGVLTSKDIVKVQPELISLRLESYDVKDEKFKPNRFFEGECEECKNFTLLERIGNHILCEDCKHRKYY